VNRAGTPGHPARAPTPPNPRLQRAVWELQMKRLRLIGRVLSGVLLALGARMVADGLTPTFAVTAGVIIVLLAASLGLARQGRRLKPTSSDPTAERDGNALPSRP
jgi:hypothetical protein